MLVQVVGDLALAAFEHDRNDLRLEVAGLNGLLGTVVALHRQRVLRLAADAPFGGNIFCGHTHVDVLERVVQCADDHIDHLGVAHSRAKAGGQAGIGATAHVFGAAADGDIGIAQQDRLAGRDDRLQAGAAQPVDIESRRAVATAAVKGRHARQVHVLRLGVDNMAKHHVANVLAVYTSARQRFANHQRGQLGGRRVLQAAAEGSNGGAHTADNNNFTSHGYLLVF